MREISKLVKYEQLFKLELKYVDDQPLDITFMIRSSNSPVAKEVLRTHTQKYIERRIRGKTPTAKQMELEKLEEAASYIESWDWKDNTYEDVVPEFSMKTAINIMDKEAWIYAQVVEAANEISNFSQTLETNSPRQSQ